MSPDEGPVINVFQAIAIYLLVVSFLATLFIFGPSAIAHMFRLLFNIFP